MDKTAVKNFATRARKRLIEDIKQKAYELGITKDKIEEVDDFDGGFRVNGRVFKKHEIKQRKELVAKIKEKGFEQVVEEAAYTWFNRFIALRFMEVNEYLPSGVRVLSSVDKNKAEPDIIKEALNVDLDVDEEVVYRLQDNNETGDLYRYLLVKQCNELGKIMPAVFEEIADYTELLLPGNLLSEGSIIRDLVESIDEEDFKNQVEIIGWLYQYYISEKKDEVFAGLKKNKKITKENIPAATQLFTPKWIVKYMVENSLGRLWLESHPNEELKSKWKYYLEEAEQEPEVQKQLEEIRNNLNPEEIKVLDPAMGSGHILVYAFDVLYEIYLSAGYSERDIPRLILEKNLYGLEIDDRAGQLAYFALMMKARSKNRRIFRRKIDLNLCAIQESNGISKEAVDYFVNGDESLKRDFQYLVDVFHDAKEYGSILDVKKIDFDAIEKRVEEIRGEKASDLFEEKYRNMILGKVPPLVKQGRIMSEKYDVVVTNPPYMGRKSMNNKLSTFVEKFYPDSKVDFFAVFIEKCLSLTKKFNAMITQHAWMFLSSFTRLREKVLESTTIRSMVHLGARAFEEVKGEVVQSTTFIISKGNINNYKANYFRLVHLKDPHKKEIGYLLKNNIYTLTQAEFVKIPNRPIVYWITNKFRELFAGELLSSYTKPVSGLSTGAVEKYILYWYEINFNYIGFGFKSRENALKSDYKYFPHNKGGKSRKWYGNMEEVVNYNKNSISEMKKLPGFRHDNRELYFKESISWSKSTSNNFCVRYVPTGFVFDNSSVSCFEGDLTWLLGLLNSKFTLFFTEIINPTLSILVGDLKKLPIYRKAINKYGKQVSLFTNICKKISKTDWDSFETSWDFKKHPLLTHKGSAATVEQAFQNWSDFTEKQFNQLKANEEELNRIFIEIYGLQDELTPEVEDKDITIRKADRERDIKSFISYAAGCMFGRYSLDEEGLAYAGGEFDAGKYKTFKASKDNVIPVVDDVYFDNDIVSRFVEFVMVTFGEETLEENLDYIAETLGKKSSETSRQAIRRYFFKGFYKDHVRTYKKRPIYWLFDSGRQNGFKALIYMHRYDPSTVARVRTDYLHELQKKYEAEINRLDIILESDVSAREKTAARKKKEKISKQLAECIAYDQVISHVANQKIEIDLDDGVKVNYARFQGIEVPQGEGKKPLKANLLAKI